MINTILFDLDGTLAPFIQDEFIKKYFYIYSELVAKDGFSRDAFMKAMWCGVSAMTDNDGAALNSDRFWSAFSAIMGDGAEKLKEKCDSFYKNEFNLVSDIVKAHTPRRPLIDELKEKGFTLVLATNPVFPPSAVASRLSWCGLKPDDFVYITTYDNSRYCKPNTEYYSDILQKIGKNVSECIMVGNNPDDDLAASKLGMEVFIVTDTIENPKNIDFSACPHGCYEDMASYLLFLESPDKNL